MPTKKKTVGAGDIGRAATALNNLMTALRARDVASATSAFFTFLDELRAAFGGQPLVASDGMVRTVTCPSGPCEWDECANECEKLHGEMTATRGDGEAIGLDFMSLFALILKIAALLRS